MLRYAIICFIIAIIAGALGLGGISDLATTFAYVLGVIALILFVIHLVTGKKL